MHKISPLPIHCVNMQVNSVSDWRGMVQGVTFTPVLTLVGCTSSRQYGLGKTTKGSLNIKTNSLAVLPFGTNQIPDNENTGLKKKLLLYVLEAMLHQPTEYSYPLEHQTLFLTCICQLPPTWKEWSTATLTWRSYNHTFFQDRKADRQMHPRCKQGSTETG